MTLPLRTFLYSIGIFCLGFSGIAASSEIPLTKNRFQWADQAFQNRKNRDAALQALERFRKLYSENTADPEAGWRLSMACYFVGNRFIQDSDQKKEIFAEGRDAGLKAVQLAPHCAPCHFWLAINMALYGQTAGQVKMLFSLKTIREHAQIAKQIDPTYAFGGSDRLLGQIDQGLPGVLGGSYKDAQKHFQDAINTVPDEPMNYLYLARLLHENLDQPKTAIEVAQKGLSIHVKDNSRVESLEAQDDLRRLLAKIKNEPLLEKSP